MADVSELSAAFRKLYRIVGELEETFREEGRHFTLDGHLLGSMGEAYAAKMYGIELFDSSKEIHDGTAPDGRLVQIKVTQRTSIGLGSEPEHLLVFHVTKDGEFIEVYNGPGDIVWELVKDRKMPKNGQYQISLSKLGALAETVGQDDRVKAL